MHQLVIILHPLLEADQKCSEPIVRRAGVFDDPAARWTLVLRIRLSQQAS